MPGCSPSTSSRIATDIAFALKHVEHAGAQLRRGRQDRVLARALAVADAGEQVTQRIGDRHILPLPARLGHAGDHPLVGEIAQHDARETELAVIAAGTPRQLAPVADARRVRRCAAAPPSSGARSDARPRRALSSFAIALSSAYLRRILLHEQLATLVLVDRTQFRHDLSPLPLGLRGLLLFGVSSCGNGKPNRRSSSRASSSVLAVVVTITSMPRMLVDLVVADLREDQLLLEAGRIIAAAVERLGVEARGNRGRAAARSSRSGRGTRTSARGAA